MSEKRKNSLFVEGPISPALIADSIAKHSTKTQIGAHSIFLGQVRDDVIGSEKVISIEYSCYTEMALDKMHEIREAAFAKYDLSCIHIYHSLGQVPAGGISLFVFTSSKHRRAAMDACDDVVERIKKELPVWGKEFFGNSNYTWKQNTDD
jgi:molybdopterin synthase catalytic subunit